MNEERARADARQKAYFERDFQSSPNVAPENRIANALEYIAFQLRQINRKLDKIAEPPQSTPIRE